MAAFLVLLSGWNSTGEAAVGRSRQTSTRLTADPNSSDDTAAVDIVPEPPEGVQQVLLLLAMLLWKSPAPNCGRMDMYCTVQYVWNSQSEWRGRGSGNLRVHVCTVCLELVYSSAVGEGQPYADTKEKTS